MHPHEALAMNEHPDGMDMPRWLSQDAITFFRGMVGGDDMQGEPMAKAWEFLKGLPEQQQYTDLPGLAEGFDVKTPQHRVGTTHPAIISMLNRLQNPHQYRFIDDDPNRGLERTSDDPMRPTLRTTGTASSNPPVRGMIQAHSGRSGMPSRSHELYSTDYGQSPQANDMGIPGVMPRPGVDLSPLTAENMRVSGTLDNNIAQTLAPPAGSQQAMIDELYERSPSSAARAFNTKR